MSRPRRLAASGLLLHVIARSSEGRRAFESDEDFRAFLALLRRYKERYRLKLYSYVLLPDHFHLMLSSDIDGGVPRAMRDLLTNYAKRYNRLHERRGTLWESRYRSVVVGEGEEAAACRNYLSGHVSLADVGKGAGLGRRNAGNACAHLRAGAALEACAGYRVLGQKEDGGVRQQRAIVGSGSLGLAQCSGGPVASD